MRGAVVFPAFLPLQFSADAEKVVPLMEAVHYFDLTLYSTGRLEKVGPPSPPHFCRIQGREPRAVPCLDLPPHPAVSPLPQHLKLLLVQLREVMEKHTDQEVLKAAARTLQVFCCPEFAFYSRVDFARSRLVDHLADRFQHDNAEMLQVPNQ